MADDDSSIGLCCLCFVVLIFGGIFIGLPVTSIYLGVTHLHDNSCPVQPNASLFLIVLGSITLAFQLVNVLQSCCQRDDDSASTGCSCLGFLGWLLTLGFFGWTITGIVWYAKAVSKRDSNPLSPDFCDQTLFAYFSAQVIMCSAFLGLLILISLCTCCCGGSNTSRADNSEVQNIITPRPTRELATGRATIQTIETNRLQAIRNGPNILYIMQKVRVDVLRVEH